MKNTMHFLDKTDYTGVDRKLIQDFLKLRLRRGRGHVY